MPRLPKNPFDDSFPSDPSGADSKAVICAMDQNPAQGLSRSRGTGQGRDCPCQESPRRHSRGGE